MPSNQLPEAYQEASQRLIFGLPVKTFLTAAAVGVVFAILTAVLIQWLSNRKEVLVFSAVRSGEPDHESDTR